MKQYFTKMNVWISIILIQLLFGDTSDKPETFLYEWSGQYGHISNDGLVVWNQDWVSGPLVFDGAFTSFPVKFGPALSDYNFTSEMKIPGNLTFPDSVVIKNYFDYRRGDYLFDQLEANAVYADSTRRIRLNGFKRSFAGSYNQYTSPSYSSSSPNQQTYRLDYQSKSEKEQVSASVLLAVTHSGIPDPIWNALHKDNILAAGLHWNRMIKFGMVDIHLASFSEKMYTSLSLSRSNINIFHPYLHLRMSWAESSWISATGLQFHNRSFYDEIISEKMTYSWVNFYVAGKYRGISWKTGPTLVQDENPLHWNANLGLDLSDERWTKKLHIQQAVHARHPLYNHDLGNNTPSNYWISKNMTATLGRQFQSGWIKTNIILGSLSYLDIESPKNFTQTSLLSKWTIWRDWSIAGDISFRHHVNELTDGYQQKINITFIATEKLFNINMDATAKLSFDGWLNQKGITAFHPIFGVPYSNQNGGNSPDIWLVNFQLNAVISSMTITWTVHNVLNVIQPLVNEVYPNLSEDLYWINPTPFFTQPEGQLITFGVLWSFDN